MDSVIVSRHRGAIDWMAHHLHPENHPARFTGHSLEWWPLTDATDPEYYCYREVPVYPEIPPGQEDLVWGKVVYGNLPLHLAALAAEVRAVEFDGQPPRGQDFTRADMERKGAHLSRYRVEKIGTLPS